MKLRNRIMSAVMALVASMTFVGITAFAADGAVSLKASATEVKAGETFTLEVSLDENPGVCAVGYKITAKTAAFDLTNAASSGLLGGSQLSKTYNKDEYKMLWIMDDMYETDYTDTGVIATLTYTVKADAAVGDYVINIYNDGSDNCAMEEPDLGSNSITIKVVADAPAKTPFAFTTDSKANDAVDGFYTQGFKADVTPNDDVVTVAATLANNDKTASVAWDGSFSGATPITFAINVLNVPATETVSATWNIAAAE